MSDNRSNTVSNNDKNEDHKDSSEDFLKYKLEISYDGSNFCGWQIQPNGETIQQTIQDKLSLILQTDIKILGASRTDSGVHAVRQVACFCYDKDRAKNLDLAKIKRSLNSLLPDSISILSIEEVDMSFHPIYNVQSKIYRYRLCRNTGKDPMIKFCYFLPERMNLDIEKISESLKYLVGEHNFKSFCASDSCASSFVRKIYEIDIFENIDNPNIIEFWFVGSGFLKQMLRNIVGTLLDVGTLKRKPEYINDLIKLEDRTKAGKLVSAEGLTLIDINYEPLSRGFNKEDNVVYPNYRIDKSLKIITRVIDPTIVS